MALDPLTAGLELGTSIINKLWPDASEQEKARMSQVLTVFTAQAEIVKAEAQSQNKLTSSWRPILMLTFAGLIVARWFGLTAPGITEAEYIKLWDIIHLGIGGYVVGRSGEKIAETVATTLKGR